MLRITEQETSEMELRLRLDGSVTDACLGELEAAIAVATSKRNTLIIDMAGVDFMSAGSARWLCQRRGDRLCLINCAPFIATLLNSCQDKNLHDETVA